MYNRYIPEDLSYTPVEPKGDPKRPQRPSPGNGSRPSFHIPDFRLGKEGLAGLLGGEGSGLSGLLKTLRLDSVDPGDVLLLLITLYLLVEGDDMELVIALGLTLLMGLGEEE